MGRFISFFRSWEPRAWAALVLLTLGVWGALALAEAVREGETGRWDRWLLQLARQPGDPGVLRGPRWLPEMVRDVTALGSVVVLALSTAGVVGFLWLLGKRWTAVFLTIATAGGALMASGLKMLFSRARPEVVPHLVHVYSSSFPSGHSMMAAITYLTLGGMVMAVVEGRLLKMYVLGLAVALSILVGVSRVLLGVHYPSDVLAGWTIGLAWSEACWLVHAWLTNRLRTPEKLQESPSI
ncbi:phosphatidylglycerophosphatase B [Caulifigura coniformis]|uniref:Phosphatidylglycerophosphatase B n=1 Tax=Caulifigura coniformis TaxID=2527983 RepID=A0A517SFF5_9PLAN|nr:phosphatase PAP2 family protein [Caulifigura coniformis]QDT54837.1 phosphatidylglycerophosphatase B [Caulifigura coniformis]